MLLTSLLLQVLGAGAPALDTPVLDKGAGHLGSAEAARTRQEQETGLDEPLEAWPLDAWDAVEPADEPEDEVFSEVPS